MVAMTAHFHALRVAEIVAETAEASSIRFDVPESCARPSGSRPASI